MLAAAYAKEPTPSPSDATVTRLAEATLLSEDDVRDIFKSLDLKARARVAESESDSSSEETDASQPASKRPKATAGPAASRAQAAPLPLEKGKLTGRKVLIPRALWPDEPCDEQGGEGWRSVVSSEVRGVVGIKTEGKIYHFGVDTVLEWRPLK